MIETYDENDENDDIYKQKDEFLIDIESPHEEKNFICNQTVSRKEFFCCFSSILTISFVSILLLMKQYIPHF